jgi:hypothetical protein
VTKTDRSRRPQHFAAAWRRSDITSSGEWLVTFTEAERDEIVTATRSAARNGMSVSTLTQSSFEVPIVSQRLREWSEMLRSGLGFVLLRRFPIEQLDDAERELAYIGLGLHLGTPVGQNAAGDILTHIRDDRLAQSGPEVRLYRTNKRQDFHTDGADIIGLLCLHGARSGGESRIASSPAVYNEILDRRPDLLEILYQPFAWDRNGEESAGEPPFFSLPPFHDVDDVPRVFYIGWYIRDAQRHPDAPRLSIAQREAMDLIESIANDPTFHVEMDFEPGDIQLLNNARILHAREAFTDDIELEERRHLLRLWLRAPEFASLEPMLRSGVPQRKH